ncbi:hypothetical protein C8T65DRAFT_663083 [Cerioporus squamosus]|nr:hypothetical protein C8T65DRAFT_663083 [Cerioporus squamosus]
MEPLKKKAPSLAKPWIEEVRKAYAGAKFFCIGNCFGAPYVMELLAEDWVTAGVFAHPSFLEDTHFKNLKRPLLLLCSEEDFGFTTELRCRAIDILIDSKEYSVVLCGGVSHAFATRADTSIPK